MAFLSYREAGNEIRHEQCTPCRRHYKYADLSGPCTSFDCPYQMALELLDRTAEKEEAEQARREREIQKRREFREALLNIGVDPDRVDSMENVMDALYLMINQENPDPVEWGE